MRIPGQTLQHLICHFDGLIVLPGTAMSANLICSSQEKHLLQKVKSRCLGVRYLAQPPIHYARPLLLFLPPLMVDLGDNGENSTMGYLIDSPMDKC